MPHMYCHCCDRKTAHKVLMKRCETEQDSVVKSMACFFSTLFQGAHYVKMEQQAFCRVCNSQSQVTTNDRSFSGAKAA